MSMSYDEKAILAQLVRREGLDDTEARRELESMRKRVLEGEDPEELLYDIGLEPDYVFALLP
jgi:hypothetical protein